MNGINEIQIVEIDECIKKSTIKFFINEEFHLRSDLSTSLIHPRLLFVLILQLNK